MVSKTKKSHNDVAALVRQNSCF